MPALAASQPTIEEPVTLGPKAKARAAEVRERIEGRPEEIPDDNNRQNLASLQRNMDADLATGAAGDAGVPESVRELISSSGQSLDASIQRAVEDRMGDSLGDVRIHTGPSAAKACEDINARAFTVGNHIAFNSGEYDPESPEGQHLLAHELAHVRQQTGGAISMMPQQNVELEIDPDPQLEREAEATAQRVMEGGELGIQRMAKTEVHVQRMADPEQIERGHREAEERYGSSVPADPEVLAKEVERLKGNQQAMMETFIEASPGAAAERPDILAAAGRGLIGGVAGGLMGSIFGPGGTAAGFAVGVAGSISSDVSKEGMDWLMDNSPGSSALEIEARIESLEQRLAELQNEKFGHGGSHPSIDW